MIFLSFVYLFTIISITFAFFIFFVVNVIYSLLLLILLVLSISCYLILMGLEFFAILFTIIYVGAVLIFFVFVIILLDLRFNKNSLLLAQKNFSYFLYFAMSLTVLIVDFCFFYDFQSFDPASSIKLLGVYTEKLDVIILVGFFLFSLFGPVVGILALFLLFSLLLSIEIAKLN